MKFEFTKKMLLVGDNTDVLNQVKIALENESEDIDLTLVSSGNKALKLLEREDFDMIVSDYQVLDMGAIEFLKEVKGDMRIRIPFVLFTRKKEGDIVLKALKEGANRVIHRSDDIRLSCKILHQAIKQEMLDYVRKKELERHRRNFDRNFRILDI